MCKYFIFIIILLGVVSCTTQNRDSKLIESVVTEEPLIYTDQCDTMPSWMLDTVIWVPLEFSDINVLRDISKISVMNGKVVVGEKHQGCIQVYDFPSGKLLFVIDKKGPGPEEYLETAAFTVTSTSIYVLDNYSHAILKYSLGDGSFIEKKSIPFVAWDMEAFDDDSFLFTWLNNNPKAVKPKNVFNNAVWQTDGEFNVIESYLPVEDDYVEMYGKRRYFTRHGKDIIFHALKYEGYFRFTQNKPPQFYPIEFNNPVPNDKALRLKDLENTSWQYLSETPFVTDDFAVFDITEGAYGQQMFSSKKQVFSNSTKWARNLPINIGDATNDNSFIGYINDDYEQYNQLTTYGFQRGSETVDSLLNQGGCCLLIYQMKKIRIRMRAV